MKTCIVILLFMSLVLITECQQTTEKEDEQQREQQQRMAEMMKYDGVKRVVAATEKSVQKLLKKNDIIVMMFWIDNEKKSESLTDKDLHFLEIIAQWLVGRKVAVATCELLSNQKFAKDVGVRYTGMMKIFNRGRVTTYYGQRSPDVLFPYLVKMLTSETVKFIETKAEKKQYDVNDLPKLIAYVNPKSKELKVLNAAAFNFQPMIPFYVVHNAKLAKSFHLKKLNSIQLVKPYEKAVSFSSKKTITEESLVDFIIENKRQRVTKMRLENLHEVWAIDASGFVVPAFAVAKTEEGIRFFSLIKSLARRFEQNKNLSFIWIDPEPFPAMVEYWSQSFEIDPSNPTFGVVDVHTQTSVWYSKPAEGGHQLNGMVQWLNDVLRKKITLNPMKTYKPPATSKEDAEDEDTEETGESEETEEPNEPNNAENTESDTKQEL